MIKSRAGEERFGKVKKYSTALFTQVKNDKERL
jgi:hypothetical protein